MNNYLVDTDVLIWYLRGNVKAKEILKKIDFSISVVTYIELLQGMRDKRELNLFKKFIKNWEINIVHINQEISLKSAFYIEEYALSHSMALADSLIAATASNYGLTLLTANDKHYKFLDIEIEVFRP